MPRPHRPIPELTPEEIARFWRQVDRAGADDCWIYGHRLTPHPLIYYRMFTCRGASYAAHRVAYTLVKGPIPDGLEIDHTCDVKACVNPSHLDAVTHRENLVRATERHRTWDIYVNWIWDVGAGSVDELPCGQMPRLIEQGKVRTRYWWGQRFINRQDVKRCAHEFWENFSRNR